MLTERIKKEFEANPAEFFGLKECKRFYKTLNTRRAYMWAYRGLKVSRSSDAPKLKLEHVKFGGEILTCKAALERFVEATLGGLK